MLYREITAICSEFRGKKKNIHPEGRTQNFWTLSLVVDNN